MWSCFHHVCVYDNGQMCGLVSIMCVCMTMDRCVVLFHYACATLDRCVVLFPSCACVTMDRGKGLFPFVAVSASLPRRQGYQSFKASERMGHKDAGARLQA